VGVLGAISLSVGCTVIVSAAVWAIAYRVGFREGRLTIPLRVVHALADHKLDCLGEHPDKVVRELIRELAMSERESRGLIASKLRSASSVEPRTLRSA